MSDVICEIVAGRLDAEVVLRNERVIAFLDHRPVFAGHVLVCPIRHVDTALDLPDDLMVPLLSTAQRVGRAQQRALGAQGSFMAINNVVSQSVPHLHLHVVPRSRGDGLRGFFWPRRTYRTGEKAEVAARLRAALDEVEQTA